MLKITGYSDKYSAHPGEEVKFYINAEYNDSYEVQLVRLIHGDTNPEGPGSVSYTHLTLPTRLPV